MREWDRIRVLTFDCYGTLVDWESGIGAYVRPHLERASGGKVALPEWFAKWERIQFELLRPYRPYTEVLAESFDRTMRAFELEVFADGGPGLARSVSSWQPFGDTVTALRRLARHRRLGIISNIDNDQIAETLAHLRAPLSLVVTAEEARAYKPDLAPFRLALERLKMEPSEVLHVAFGWRYDLAAARAVGMQTCWLHRNATERPTGETPDIEVGSLTALQELLSR